jgi:hypothetical protein
MATRFQQRALLRKVVYLALILVLLTASLVHRRFFIVPQAYNLQLREEARGEVDLTSSAVQLLLTGSRGLTTCGLWLAAIEKQKKHEWSEMDLLVRSITKVQPYFVSPWLFQSWNLSFNVAVECDRVRDKYYYISRGLELLAEGERRNQGGEVLAAGESKRIRFPGNPEMRFYMGFTYQLKVGQGDEQDALRCLFDMSCIDPADRDPAALWAASGEEGQEVDLAKFERFCRKYPRLVRRMRESALALSSPRMVADFLRDNKEVPSRYEKPQRIPGAEPQPTRLRPLTQRFPILPPPPPEILARHGVKDRDKIDDFPADEDFDVFGVCRVWYDYAQQPLPPPNPEPGVNDEEFGRTHYNKLLHRLPKMSQHIFRSYPARAQTYYAENLEKEGWFDADGWLITRWFDGLRGGTDVDVRVGTESKYHARPAWTKAYEMYKQYGLENGLYLPPAQRRELTEKARPYLAKHKAEVGQAPDVLSAADERARLGPSRDAAVRLKWNAFYRNLTNYDAYLHQTDAERLPGALAGRKALFQAERLRRVVGAHAQALALYETTLPQWVLFLLGHLDFARLSVVQEETYEAELRYLRLLQGEGSEPLKALVTGVAQLALTLPVPFHRAETYANEQTKIIPIRNVRGPLDMIYFYDQPDVEELRAALVELTQQAVRPPFVLPAPLKTWLTSHTLVVSKSRGKEEATPRVGWRPLIEDDVIAQVRDRLGLTRQQQPAQPAPAPAAPERKARAR